MHSCERRRQEDKSGQRFEVKNHQEFPHIVEKKSQEYINQMHHEKTAKDKNKNRDKEKTSVPKQITDIFI